ncbi:MAG: LysM peptidoglycan-binding domain-containing M23 family metallopeptidase [Chloroflexi bacterium]|nr:LysM peptidoglycan-binding domain-containing M23 family metallopeptidase [Chloroflexota bacterium]
MAGERLARWLSRRWIVTLTQLAPRRADPSLTLRLSPRAFGHALVVAIVSLVALFAGPRRTEVEAATVGWTFEPFSRSVRVSASGEWLRPRAEVPFEEQIVAPPVAAAAPAPAPPSAPAAASAPVAPRPQVQTYIVRVGDTLSGIARAYGVSLDTLRWANKLDDIDFLSPGTQLRVPPGSGVLHTVQPGETLQGIAERYGVSTEAITAHPFNAPEGGIVARAGRELFIPGGTMPRPTPAPVAQRPPPSAPPAPTPVPAAPAPPRPAVVPAPPPGGNAQPASAAAPIQLGYPTAGQLVQGYSAAHRGIDIIADYGNPVYAAGPGVVVLAAMGYNGGFGNMVEIDHGNGIVTRYAHLSAIQVSPGKRVAKGEVIGLIGQSGIATAPHVHFEVLVNGVRSDPMPYLR